MGLLTDKFFKKEEPFNPDRIVRRTGHVEGRVQGVGFRMFVRNSAREANVTGWVKNMSDGSVAMELQGKLQVIEKLTEKIKVGRGRINVTNFELSDLPVSEGEKNFAIRK